MSGSYDWTIGKLTDFDSAVILIDSIDWDFLWNEIEIGVATEQKLYIKMRVYYDALLEWIE